MKYNAYFDKSTKALAGAVSAIALCAATATAAFAQEPGVSVSEETRQFDIEAQPLSRAIAEFSRQSDINVVASSRMTMGLRSQALKGEMRPQEALKVIIGDAALDPQMQANGSIVLAENDQSADFRDRSLIRVAQVLDVSSEDPASEDDAYLDADEVIVTGTNIRGVENPTVPVLQFDREDIDLSGAATVDDFLRTIPQNFASETQLTAESGNPFTSGRNRSQGTSVDLRGLGGGSTLVLLNGRRLPFSGDAAIVDVNVIPLGAIERIEVLTDGATAVYGSDAVGGVINFITRDNYRGLDVNARYGTVTEGSREDWGVGGAGGFSWGSGSAFAGVDYQEEKPLLVEERDFINLVNGREGATLGSDTERLGVSGNVKQEIGSKLRLAVNTFYSNTTSESFSVTNSVPEINLSEQTSLSINPSIEYDVTDRITASFFADITRNRTDATATETISGTVRPNNIDNDLTVYEVRISGQAVDLPGGAVSFSLGGLYRSEEFLLPVIGGTADDNIVGERDIWAGYGELLLPIFGDANALPFVQKFEVSVAGRYEDYSDFGDSFDPKIGLFWEVNDDLSFRASYSEAFRAPDLLSINTPQFVLTGALPESFFTGQRPDEAPGIDDFFGFGPAYTYIFPTGGNPDLRPERAKTWSAGFAYEPGFLEGLSLEGNFFDISYKDRLENILFTDSIQNPAFFELADVNPNVNDIQAIFDREAAGEITISNFFGFTANDIQVLFSPRFTNVAERDVRGVDLTFNYTREMALGDISVGANATYLIDYIGRLTALAPSSDDINTLYRPIDFKLRGDLSWSRGGFTAFTAINYVDGYRDNIDGSIANGIDAWTTIDLSLSYETGTRFDNMVVNNVRFGFNVTNLFDNDPPFVATPFGLNFDSANATPWGRQVNFTIAKSF